MGASHSTSSSQPGGGRPRTAEGIDVQDYYGILELPDPTTTTSTSEEIRKAYRKLALRYHPDKNPDDVEAANKRFHLIQAAYDVLSDDQEKAWYDAHREQILGGTMNEDGIDADEDEGLDEEMFQSFRSGSKKPPPAPSGSSLPGLTPRQLMRFLDVSLCMDVTPPSADESGFYGTFRRLFERLAEEEKGAAPYPGDKLSDWESMPSFGYSHTPYLHPKGEEKPLYQDQVRDFYSAWASFSSRKGFGWKDGYRLHDAPDRRMRRGMEKENKKMRDEGRREYNDIVRSLVNFVRKRDPRVKAYLATQSASVNTAEDLQRRKEAAERERKEKEEIAKSYRSQNWDAWHDGQEVESEIDSEASFGEQVESNKEQVENDADGEQVNEDVNLECFVCDKVFQSQAAFENHEKSNKHKKQIQLVKRQMQKEDKELQEQVEETLTFKEEEEEEHENAGLSKKARQRLKKRLKEQEKAATSAQVSDEEQPEFKVLSKESSLPQIGKDADDNNATPNEGGKSKARRSKKDKKDFNSKERCNVCLAGFESRSKLFNHVRESNHFLAPGANMTKKS